MMNYAPLILISLFSIGLVSCSDNNNNDLHEYIQRVKQRELKTITPIPPFSPVSGFKFHDAENRRNPFSVINKKKYVDSFAPDKQRIKQALEAYPLDALKFVGTLIQDDQIWGLIRQPNSQIVHVHIGDYMGQNYGRIIMIKDNSIKLEETIKGSSGGWEKYMTTLDLHIGK